MKHGHAWAIGLLALTLSACGGSDHHGGGTASTSTTTNGPGLTSAYRIEAVLTNPSLDPDYVYEDPLDIQVLDSVTFELVNYPSGTAASRAVAPAVGTTAGSSVTFTTNDTLNTAGILTPAGLFTAGTTDSGATRYIVSAEYLGQVYTALYQTQPRLNTDRVVGQVVSGGVGVYNAEVDFYGPRDGTSTARSVVVATVRTGPDGTFRATVPLTYSVTDGTLLGNTFTVRQPTGYPSTFSYTYTDANGNSVTGSFTNDDANLTDQPPITLATTETNLGTITLGSVAQAAVKRP